MSQLIAVLYMLFTRTALCSALVDGICTQSLHNSRNQCIDLYLLHDYNVLCGLFVGTNCCKALHCNPAAYSYY